MNDLMISASSQIPRAVSEAVNEQGLPQIQATLRSGRGQMPRKGWNFPSETPEYKTGESFNCKFRSSLRDEFPRNLIRDEDEEDTHYRFFFIKYTSLNVLNISVTSKRA